MLHFGASPSLLLYAHNTSAKPTFVATLTLVDPERLCVGSLPLRARVATSVDLPPIFAIEALRMRRMSGSQLSVPATSLQAPAPEM